jgi:anaerobic selenocysteine-containing dehydrogenase
MLVDAKTLRETARTPSVWVNAEDAAAGGLADGATVAVVGSDARMELPVKVTRAVARGVVVVPGSSTVEGGGLGGGARVRLETAVAVGEGS